MNRSLKELIVLIAVALLDRVTKQLALAWCIGERVFMPGISCRLALNRGMAFSIGSTAGSYGISLIIPLITAVLLIVCCGNGYQLWRRKGTILPWGLIVTGAVGNLVDRFRYGAVVDFIEIHWGDWYWPTFNVADICICAGVALLLFTKE